MGYNSNMEYDLQIKKDKLKDFLSKVEDEKKNKTEIAQYFLCDMEINEDGILDWEESYKDHGYDEEEFVTFIADYVEEGKLVFTGEDDEKCGYHFDGKGNVLFIEFVEEVSDIYFIKKPGETTPMEPYKLDFTIDERDFEQTFGRKPKDNKEFEAFCHYCEKGLNNGHIDWNIVFDCAKDAMR